MHLRNEIPVSVSSKRAWEVMGEEFGNIGLWVASLESSHLVGDLGVGAHRVCNGLGFGPFPPSIVKEKLVHFDPQKREFSYELTEGNPWFITHARNNWTITSVDENNSIIKAHAVVDIIWFMRPLAWVLPALLKKQLALFTEELSYFIESGNIHPRKQQVLGNT
ncbi:SRPBCC family protein [Agaribacter marinus]|uniref:Polyketide cyclase / dehydrase and lipid transport n=1 Tax=Agaribacter marinus TaxID=1431249 RepID=A0AA37SUP8_9ALTE|nr:SRPBCC family protein [Agaribacter marinus]GLR70206.1 hypothetical protein GCM10007852_11140 [Agaribacter marinus]